MRNIMTVCCSIILLLSASGCMVMTPTGPSSVYPAVIYTDMKMPAQMQESISAKTRRYQVLGEVHGQSQTQMILLIAAYGDGSFEAARVDALRKIPGAQDLIDVRVDTEVSSFLTLFNKVVTHVNGKAIKYID